MVLTQEQELIVNSIGDLKINAVAGSGKTSTLIEYAKRQPSNSRILYLAFNRSVKNEAESKFKLSGLNNVTIETAHSLAFKQVVNKNGYKVKASYSPEEITEILGIEANKKHAEFILANHINKFVSYFCNSNKDKVEELDYRDVVYDNKAKLFVDTHYKDLEFLTRIFLKKMNEGEIEVTHDFYLKKFQLSNPKLDYDYILFDEGQDASPAILDVFVKQKCTKMIVGDTHQQIYSWRYAVNSLEQVNYPTYTLSTSFRFGKEIASLAKNIISWKNNLHPINEVIINGQNADSICIQPKTILARTNLGLLLRAISFVGEKGGTKRLYFEGNINTYTYAEDGTSLYDVLYLNNGQRASIRSKLIKSMNNMYELQHYVDNTEDVQLAMMIDLVKQYGDSIFGIIRRLKEQHIEDSERHTADMIFSTVHKSKGMEYDSIELADDFLTEKQIKERGFEGSNTQLRSNRILEEINLLYVAVTRAKFSVFLPDHIIPEEFKNSHVIKGTSMAKKTDLKLPKPKSKQYKNYKKSNFSEEEQRQYLTIVEDTIRLSAEGFTVKEIADHQKLPYNEVRDRVNGLMNIIKQRKNEQSQF